VLLRRRQFSITFSQKGKLRWSVGGRAVAAYTLGMKEHMTRGSWIAAGFAVIAASGAYLALSRPIAGVPANISSDLIRRGCAPIAPPPKHQANILTGEFLRQGETAWAVLCRAGKSDLVLVYPDDSGKGAMEVARYPSSPPSRDPEYIPTIRAADAEYVRRHSEPAKRSALPALERPAIEHAFGMGSTIFYYEKGKWLRLPGAD
jgi:hypothetical protein